MNLVGITIHKMAYIIINSNKIAAILIIQGFQSHLATFCSVDMNHRRKCVLTIPPNPLLQVKLSKISTLENAFMKI